MDIKCEKCKTKNDQKNDVCSSCGYDLKKQKKKGCIFTIIFLTIIGLLLYFLFSGGEEEEKVLSPAELREQEISKCFSAWDGSHIELTRIIKKALNDEESYKHIETSYYDKDSILIIETIFSAKNAFGGVLKSKVIVEADLNCNVTKSIQWFQ